MGSNPTFYKNNLTNECLISNKVFNLSFKKLSKGKWISNPGPTGLCDIVLVVTIERDNKNPFLWKYTQHRVTANKESEFCKMLNINDTTLGVVTEYSTADTIHEEITRCDSTKYWAPF